jgi:hypothetical protein
MEPESPSPYPQVPATCPYPEPTSSSPHNPFQLPEDPSPLETKTFLYIETSESHHPIEQRRFPNNGILSLQFFYLSTVHIPIRDKFFQEPNTGAPIASSFRTNLYRFNLQQIFFHLVRICRCINRRKLECVQ